MITFTDDDDDDDVIHIREWLNRLFYRWPCVPVMSESGLHAASAGLR